MATGDIAATGGAQNLLNLIGMFKGSTTTKTQTTKPDVTAEGMNALVQQILGGTQGLASVATGQKVAGLYGSTTNQMLLNDLISRTAGELAKAQAGTTTTETTKVDPKFGASDIATGLGLAGLVSLLGPSLQGILGEGGTLNKAGTALADVLGLGTSKVGPGGIGGTAGTAGAEAADTAGGLLSEFGSSDAYNAAIGGTQSLFSGTADSADLGITVEDLLPGTGSSGGIVTGLDLLSGLVNGTVDVADAGITLEDLKPGLTGVAPGAVSGTTSGLTGTATDISTALSQISTELGLSDSADLSAALDQLSQDLGLSGGSRVDQTADDTLQTALDTLAADVNTTLSQTESEADFGSFDDIIRNLASELGIDFNDLFGDVPLDELFDDLFGPPGG